MYSDHHRQKKTHKFYGATSKPKIPTKKIKKTMKVKMDCNHEPRLMAWKLNGQKEGCNDGAIDARGKKQDNEKNRGENRSKQKAID